MGLYNAARLKRTPIHRRTCAGQNENGRFPEEAPVWVRFKAYFYPLVHLVAAAEPARLRSAAEQS
ncbi:hypothetical protein C1Y08_04810 [Pseudomonas sp. FW306-02-F02-AA]|uniref:Uncharacterized protein n=1 Tax=Pseudomonas fluorescens TaxID=294 RepID=A0A0N7H126_PSEFL|nr:hypothetical protein AO353_28285 [Pseudomonas fluorescens]PMZ05484.1 hypothetical protein C1Y07_03335 [Pseudomonas sp. FW306-02-F02-AB]PMZ17009.1 hypothetical protein C1Y08_04810 [Pseudomonas sp. FW306-02-F02-AA]PMZ23254.1 hypothetical protein C1Y09_03415 [Pseudomonas sp. FW306-02-F08-AA]PMZ29083.1 hypothetical protein C1Y05_03820 [Pseudomonas sp. FW306-02-F04-BA]PMZ36420.1 hypothetical protein C1X99_00460 [Pseudomonas sp. FW306-02-H06B]PMZ41187.1 hypothetical protein C1Y00_07335 [Pseudomo